MKKSRFSEAQIVAIAPGENVEIRNINGPIGVTRASGDIVSVKATRTADRSDPNSARITVTRDREGIIVCAIRPAQDPSDCARRRGGSHYHSDHDSNDDVRVAFTITLPRVCRRHC